MRIVLVGIAVLMAGGCDRSDAPAAPSAGSAVAPATEQPAAPADAQPVATPSVTFTDRVWLRSDPGSAPGAMQAFLSSGTLLADSCFETYRLSSWRLDGDRELVWNEDGIDVRARIVSVDAGALVLRLELRGGDQEQHFSAATVPYVCPDLPR